MNASQLILPFLAALAVTNLLLPLARKLSLQWGAVAQPGGRHIHKTPTPRLGGLAVGGSVLLVVLATLAFAPEKLQFVTERILGIDRNLVGVLLGGLILLATGVYDSIYDLSPFKKLFFQTVAAVVVVAFGVKIHWLSNPFGGPDIVLGPLTYLIVPLWLVTLTNVMNWFDGLDGLASGLSVIASAALAFLALQPFVDQPATAYLAAVVAGAAAGFLPWNWHPAKIFLGDAGSMFLGFMVGVFAIISGAKFATAALVLGIPIIDAVWVVTRRLLAGQPITQGDTKHLHHRFLAAGFSVPATALIIYTIAILFGLIALFSSTEGKVTALGWLLVTMVVLGILLTLREKRRKA